MTRKFFMVFGFILVSVLLLLYQNDIFESAKKLHKKWSWFKKSEKACPSTNIKPNDKIAMEYLKKDFNEYKHRYDACENKNIIELIEIIETVNGTILQINSKDYNCYAQCFDKQMNITGREESIEMFKKLNFVNESLSLSKHGFYYVNCQKKTDSKIIFNNVVTIFPKNISVIVDERKRFREYEETLHKRLNFTNDEPNVLKNDEMHRIAKRLNVLMIGFDSLSRFHFQRILPLTYTYLKNQLDHNHLFEQFNSVGEKTYSNLIPALAGVLVSNIDSLNMKNEQNIYESNDDTYHDQYPFIWYEYEKQAGYLTAYQEDQPYVSLCNYLKNGFRYQPTAYYGRAFWLKYYEIRTGPRYCHNLKPMYKLYIELIENFLQKAQQSSLPYFSLNFLTEYTHDFLSVPKQMDAAFYNMLKKFEKNGYFDNTLLVVFSDHGNRLTKFTTDTTIGKLERYLPFLSIRMPDVLINTQLYQNLKSNSDKLVGNFDVYQTLRHFLHINMKLTMALNTTQYTQNYFNTRHLRGISLFEPIPSGRTCSNALIPDEQCPCYERVNITEVDFKHRTSHTFTDVTNLILNKISNITNGVKKLCAPYKLDKITTAKYLHSNALDLYQFIIILQPGDAWFEIFLEQKQPDKLHINGKINRLSVYGNQSLCVDDPFLRNYCYCVL